MPEIPSNVPQYFRGHLMYSPPPEAEKSRYKTQKEWQDQLCMESLGYAISRMSYGRQQQITKINQLFNSYIGITNESAMNWLQATYGDIGIALYHDYRLSKTKLDQLQGEWLLRPLSTTVYSVNSEARAQMLEDHATQIGIKQAKEQIDKLRTVVGVDPYNGMQGPSPEDSDDDIWKYVSAKQENNFLMQEILNKLVEQEEMKMKLSQNLQDLTITSECFGKAYIDEHGFDKYRDIDPRNALFEESMRDPFLHRSPYLGEKRPLYIHEIYTNFSIPKDKTEEIEKMVHEYRTEGQNPDWGYKGYYRSINQSIAIDTYTIEWFAVKPYYFKKTSDRTTLMDYDYYSNNEKKIQGEVKRGKYQVDVKYKMVTWEATKIGHRMYINCREKPNVSSDLENPYGATRSYGGLLFGTKNGIRVSIQQQVQHINKLYNITMFQIQRESAKYKGKVLPIDRAGLPKGKTMKQTLTRMTNDGVIDFNSAAEGNTGNRDLDMRNNMKEMDMGLSNSFSELRALKVELERTMDVLTGINSQRQGQTSASQPLGSQENDINQSYAITEPLTFMFNHFCEEMLNKMMQNGKITYGFLHPDKGAILLGDSGVKFLTDTKAVSECDYGMFLADGRKEQKIRQIMHDFMPQAIVAKELRVVDAVQASLGDTIDQTIAILNKGWKVVQDVAAKQQQAQAQSQQQITAQNNASMLQAQDKQNNAKQDSIILQGLIKQGILTQEAMNKWIHDEADREQEQKMNAMDVNGEQGGGQNAG